MKLTDREYRILLAECASRMFGEPAITGTDDAVVAACDLLSECGIENEADSDPSLKVP